MKTIRDAVSCLCSVLSLVVLIGATVSLVFKVQCTYFSDINGRPSLGIPYQMNDAVEEKRLLFFITIVTIAALSSVFQDISTLRQSKQKIISALSICVSAAMLYTGLMLICFFLEIASPSSINIYDKRVFLSMPKQAITSEDKLFTLFLLLTSTVITCIALIQDLKRLLRKSQG